MNPIQVHNALLSLVDYRHMYSSDQMVHVKYRTELELRALTFHDSLLLIICIGRQNKRVFQWVYSTCASALVVALVLLGHEHCNENDSHDHDHHCYPNDNGSNDEFQLAILLLQNSGLHVCVVFVGEGRCECMCVF